MFSSRSVKVRDRIIGGQSPILVQTMYDSPISGTDTENIVQRINSLAAIGCDIIRFAFTSRNDIVPFSEIASRSPIPVVADIHFDWRMALLAIQAGADKIRINPGNTSLPAASTTPASCTHRSVPICTIFPSWTRISPVRTCWFGRCRFPFFISIIRFYAPLTA